MNEALGVEALASFFQQLLVEVAGEDLQFGSLADAFGELDEVFGLRVVNPRPGVPVVFGSDRLGVELVESPGRDRQPSGRLRESRRRNLRHGRIE